MKLYMILNKTEIDTLGEVLETISSILPEELGFEIPNAESMRLENGRYFDEEKYGNLLIEEHLEYYDITVDLKEGFTVDVMNLMKKAAHAAAPVVGALVGFIATMKVVGGRFVKKVANLGAEFSKKWFAPAAIEETTTENSEEEETTTENSEESDASQDNKAEEHENKYGVYPLKFLWDNNDGNARCGVVTVIVEKCDYIHSGFRVIDKKANVSFNSNFETTYEKAECQLFMDLGKYGFEPMFSDFNEARLEMLNKFDEMIRRTPLEKPDDTKEELDQMLQTTFDDSEDEISMDELEKACENPTTAPKHLDLEEVHKEFGEFFSDLEDLLNYVEERKKKDEEEAKVKADEEEAKAEDEEDLYM